MPTRIYRITHIENLATILDQGGMWCGNETLARDLPFKSIGNTDLTSSRHQRVVRCAASGTLNDYVPFYFCPRSVMLYLISKRHQSTYGGGQEPIIYFVSSVESIASRGIPFAFTDRNAFIRTARYSDDLDELGDLPDWEVIESGEWASTDHDPDRKERKQAEFLVHNYVPLDCVKGIAVYSERYRKEVAEQLQAYKMTLPIQIKTSWYYN